MQRQTVTWLPSKQGLQAAPCKILLPSTHLELAPFKEPRLETSIFLLYGSKVRFPGNTRTFSIFTLN